MGTLPSPRISGMRDYSEHEDLKTRIVVRRIQISCGPMISLYQPENILHCGLHSTSAKLLIGLTATFTESSNGARRVWRSGEDSKELDKGELLRKALLCNSSSTKSVATRMTDHQSVAFPHFRLPQRFLLRKPLILNF
jgi:hypothetical protein